MLQALAALLGAAFTVAACYACGALLIDPWGINLHRSERIPLAFLVGAACLHLAIFTLLALQIGYWPVLLAPLALAIVLSIWHGSWRLHGEPMKPLGKGTKIVAGVLFGAYMVLYFFHAWAPETSPDGSGYHLAEVASYVRMHGFARIGINLYTSLGQGVEMLFVPAFIIGRHSAAALFHLAFAVALAMLMVTYGQRIGKPWVGVAGAFLTFASPVVGIDASSAYNDVAAAAVVFGAFYCLQLWEDDPHLLLLIPVGLLAGYAYAIKYTAVMILPLALIFVAYRTRKLKPLLVVAACSIAMIAPWMIKDWIQVHNPVAPFANRIFPNAYMHPFEEQVLAQMMSSYGVTSKWSLPIEVIARGYRTNGLIGPIFFALPLALLALRERAGRRLLAASAILMATYFANVGTRFLIPALPFFSLAMVLPLAGAPQLLVAMMVFHAVASWPNALERYARNAWDLDNKILWKQALRVIPQDTYLRNYDASYGAAHLIEASVPKGERVLAVNGIADSYTSREILVSFRSSWNQVLTDALDAGYQTERQPRIRQTFSFPERSLRRIRVRQTAATDPMALWSVNELRFFDRGAELPRNSDWRLRAWPNPWEVQLAFDNSGPTRWRTWAPAKDAYLEVDFGKPVLLDQIHVDTSYDYFLFKPIVEAMDDSGKWTGIARDPAIGDIPEDHNIRRASTDFLKSQGIHYLMIQDNDFEAEDLSGDPEGWGLTKVASGYGITVYRIM